MVIIVKNQRGSIVLRIDRRVVVSLVILGLAMLYSGVPL